MQDSEDGIDTHPSTDFEVVGWTRSRGQGTTVSVIIYNDWVGSVRFEWLDWRGDVIDYGTRPADPHHAAMNDMVDNAPLFDIETFSLHPWRVVEAGSERELVRVRFLRSCAVQLTELVDAANSFAQALAPWPQWCEGVRLSLDLTVEKQLAFAMASHERLGKASVASCVDNHVLQLILDGRRAIPGARHPTIDAECLRSMVSIMKPLHLGMDMACDRKGNIYLADCAAGRVMKIRRRDGEVLWSQKCRTPLGIVYDEDEQVVLVVARGDNKVVCLQGEDGQPVARFGDHHDADSVSMSVNHLSQPCGIAIHGNLIYVADTGMDEIKVFRCACVCLSFVD